MRAVAVGLTAGAWFWHCYERNLTLGYDFAIYYLAGGGTFTPGWVYADPLAYFFWPLSLPPFPLAFGVWYLVLALSWYGLARRLPLWLFLLSFYPALLGLETANVTLLLEWACLSPLGTVLASVFKPYLGLFVLLHAYGLYAGRGGRTPQEPPCLPLGPVRGL